MVENRPVSDGTNETQNQTRQLAVRFAPEIVARIEADAAAKDASPTEIVREIVCEHYGRDGETAGVRALSAELTGEPPALYARGPAPARPDDRTQQACAGGPAPLGTTA